MILGNSSQRSLFVWSAIFLSIWPLVFWDNPFFWDTVLFSRQADWYLQSGFSTLILPTELDAGHPPLWPLYLALGWKILGQHLIVSHLLMLPILIWLAWELSHLVTQFVSAPHRNWAMACAVAVPGLLAQATLFSNDILLAASLLGVLNALQKEKYWKIALCLSLAGMSSLRGIMIAPAVLMYAWIFFPQFRLQFSLYLWGAAANIPLVVWFGWHWVQTGWLTHPISSNWSSQHELGNLDTWVHNFLTIGFRFADQGRIVLWVGIFWVWLHGKWKYSSELTQLIGLFLLLTLWLSLVFIPFQNPPGHRYFLLEFILLAILSVQIIFQTWPDSIKVKILVLISFLSGHFWIYPESISKGWDSTLSYVNWSQERLEAVNYLKENQIPPEFVGSAFPLVHSGKYTHLNEEVWRFSEMDLSKNPYILYSNLCNGVSESTLKILNREWDVERSWGSWPVYFILYRNPEQFPVEPKQTPEMAIVEL